MLEHTAVLNVLRTECIFFAGPLGPHALRTASGGRARRGGSQAEVGDLPGELEPFVEFDAQRCTVSVRRRGEGVWLRRLVFQPQPRGARIKTL